MAVVWTPSQATMWERLPFAISSAASTGTRLPRVSLSQLRLSPGKRRRPPNASAKRIVLIDGTRLGDLMIRHDVGCRIEETLHVKKVDEDFFLES